MKLTSITAGDLVEVKQESGALRQVGLKSGRQVTTYWLHDALFEHDAIEATGFDVIAHYKKLSSKSNLGPGSLVKVNRRGRMFYAVLKQRERDVWLCHPLSGNYFRIQRREIVTVYSTRRAAGWLEQLAA